MTKRERVLRTINFQETDRIPVYDLIDNNNIREYYGGGKINEGNAWEFEYAAVRNALDMTRGLMISNFYPGRTTVDEDGFIWYHDKDTSWIEKRPFDDVEGLRKWVEKDIEKRNKWNPDRNYVEEYRKTIMDHMKGIGDDTIIVVESDVGFEFARHRAGIELFSYFMVEYPELLSDWLEALNQAEIKRAKAIADPELVPVMLTYSDIAFKTGPIFSPEFMRKEFFPRLKRLNNTYQEAGVKCLFHKDWVKRKLDEIDRLFPPERLNKSKARWEKVWRGEKRDDRYPFHTGFPLFNPYNIKHPPEERLKAYLDACMFMGQMNDDFIPAIFPGLNHSTIPSMFGAREITKGIESTCERIIDSVEDIDRLPEPYLGPETVAYQWLVMQEYLLNNGAALSADSLVMVSPDYYDQFYKPYLERIGKTFGGLAVHSCGNFTAVVKNLCNTPYLKAINASQLSVEQLLNAGMDKSKVVIALLYLDELETNMKLIKENSMNASISILDIWPMEEGKLENLSSWTKEDWKEIRRKEERIIEIMSV